MATGASLRHPTTAQAYGHTLVTGNDGRVCITDITAGAAGAPSGGVAG
jgi:hypothetical protein